MWTSFAPSRQAERAASMAVSPPPTTTTTLPVQVGQLAQRRCRAASARRGRRRAGPRRARPAAGCGVRPAPARWLRSRRPARLLTVKSRAQLHAAADLHAGPADVVDLGEERLARQAVGRDAVGHHAARLRHTLEDGDAVALLGQAQRRRQAARPCADHGHLACPWAGPAAAASRESRTRGRP